MLPVILLKDPSINAQGKGGMKIGFNHSIVISPK
jgi:hypothetical protein